MIIYNSMIILRLYCFIPRIWITVGIYLQTALHHRCVTLYKIGKWLVFSVYMSQNSRL